MGERLIGIDVTAAAFVVQRWRRTSETWDAVAAETVVRSGSLLLDAAAPARAAADVAEGLRLVAATLAARSRDIEDLGWRPVAWRAPGGGERTADTDSGTDQELEALMDWLASGARGSMLRELVEPSAAAWDEMVGAGTLVDGSRTMRYFDIAADPGSGVIVVDFFIPDSRSLVLEGDGRGHDDPVFGDLAAGDSRLLAVFDLETGRAMVQLDDTCLVGGLACNEARPIEMDGAEVVWSPSTDLVDYALPGVPLPVSVLEIPNQFSVDSSPGRLRVDYDVLNGIVPVGSVDGTFTLASDGAGRYRVERLDTDRYPSIGVYHYRRGRRVEVLAQQDSAGVWSAFPLVPAVTDTVATAVDGAGELAADVGRAVRDVWERW